MQKKANIVYLCKNYITLKNLHLAQVMLELLLLVPGWRPQVGAGCWGGVNTLDTLHCVQQPGNGVGGRHAQTCNNDIIINQKYNNKF